MRTQRAKQSNHALRRGDMRIVMKLLELYDACLKNAESLLEEARLLFRNGFFPRAFALAHTGWEEIGKAQLVGDFLNEMVSQEEFEQAFKDHKLKSAYNWRRFVLNPDNIADSTIEYDRSKATNAFEKRQAAFYVQKKEDYVPVIPSQQVSRQEAAAVIDALMKELTQIREFDAMNERVGSASFPK